MPASNEPSEPIGDVDDRQRDRSNDLVRTGRAERTLWQLIQAMEISDRVSDLPHAIPGLHLEGLLLRELFGDDHDRISVIVEGGELRADATAMTEYLQHRDVRRELLGQCLVRCGVNKTVVLRAEDVRPKSSSYSLRDNVLLGRWDCLTVEARRRRTAMCIDAICGIALKCRHHAVSATMCCAKRAPPTIAPESRGQNKDRSAWRSMTT